MVPGTVTPEPSPQSPPAENPSRKRKYFDEKLIDSSCFKIRALLRQLRPQVIDVLRTSDFRNCRAAYEVKMQMKLLMDLYRQMTSDIKPLDKVASESHPLSSENVLQKQPWHGKEDVTLREQVQPEQSMEESSEKEHPPSSNSSVKLDDSYIRGSYIVGGSAFGWNFITCSGSMPVYYGVTKEAYRNASKMSRIGDSETTIPPEEK
ncbi:hypothetical protein K2173_026646 [Erythroxylum novogranatense]|uniref:Uncharacterized protein n=1 Tax=Erythroxylum novogranatense TaxID=1862640 RepID=A0AAV8TZI4_9ROSI|nr:hypothetical protein K2173_026646 [Erythroxylum novogranatense]